MCLVRGFSYYGDECREKVCISDVTQNTALVFNDVKSSDLSYFDANVIPNDRQYY